MKKLITLLLALVMVVGLVACGAKEEAAAPAATEAAPAATEAATEAAPKADGEVHSIAFICGGVNQWNQDLFVQAQKEAEARGWETNMLTSDHDFQKEADIVLNCVTQGYDAIVVQPSNTSSIGPALREAAEAGVLCISLNPIKEEAGLSDVVHIVEFDEFGAGVCSAETYVELMGESGKAAIITGKPGAENSEYRTNGNKSVLEKYPGYEVVQVVACSWDRQQAMAAAEDIMTANPDLTVFFSHDDSMSLGIYEAIKAAGKEDTVKIASLGLTEDGANYIKEGKILCSVAAPAGLHATASFEMLDEWLEKGKIEKNYEVGYYPVTIDNVDEAEW